MRSTVIDTELRRCLFCRAPLPAIVSGAADVGVRFAYDADRGRFWSVCAGCGRWNLADADERWNRIDRLEHAVRRDGRLLAATQNVALFDVTGTAVLRVGPAPLPEQAWWRYGRTLRGRRSAFRGVATRISAYAGGAFAYVGGRVGPRRRIPSFAWEDSAMTDSLRWWRFGAIAWVGRSRCLHCNSVLRAFEFDDAWHAQIILDTDGRPTIGLPCTRCDPWTPERLFRIVDDESELLLRRILAYQNIAGGTSRLLEHAAGAIQDAGSADSFVRDVAGRAVPLRRLGPALGLALEIAVNESAERRVLETELTELEKRWETEDEIARIVDELE